MLRASLMRLPVIITFLNSAILGVVLALLMHYYYSVPAENSRGSHFPPYRLHRDNTSSRIASQLWHSHDVVGMHLIVYMLITYHLIGWSLVKLAWSDFVCDKIRPTANLPLSLLAKLCYHVIFGLTGYCCQASKCIMCAWHKHRLVFFFLGQRTNSFPSPLFPFPPLPFSSHPSL